LSLASLNPFGRAAQPAPPISPTQTLNLPLTNSNTNNNNNNNNSNNTNNNSSNNSNNSERPPIPTKIRSASTEEGTYAPPSFEQVTTQSRSSFPDAPPPPPFPGGGGDGRVDDAKVAALTDMGFESDKVRLALKANDNSQEAALNSLLSG